MAHHARQDRNNLVLRLAAPIAHHRFQIQPFVKLKAVVADAPETAGLRITGNCRLDEGLDALAIRPSGIRGRPGEFESIVGRGSGAYGQGENEGEEMTHGGGLFQ